MKTAVRRILLMSALMAPGSLYALGLGEIHLNSALNQPFDADIELVSAAQEDLAALRAALASGEAFARAGLDRPAYLADFTFRVTQGANGADIVKVTSPRPVTEPFVSLLVEASWPRGRLVREYTVLLDPPVYAPAPVAEERPIVAPRASSTAVPAAAAPSTAAAAPSTPAAPRAPRPAAAPAPSLQAGSTYKVRPNDTLWKIASSANPGPRAEVNRAMVAIYQKNTHAFDGNINLLKSGATLQLPQASEVQSISAAAASAEVARQYQMWHAGTPAAGEPAEAARLRLVTPEQGTAAPSTATAPAAAGKTPAQAVAPGAAQAPATDVNARVKQLESELAEARRLLEVRNAELATLQGQAAGAAPAQGAAPEAATVPATPAAAAAPAAEEPAAAPQPAKKPKAAKPPAPAEPSLLDRVINYWWVLAAALAALAGVALVQRMRRGEDSTEVDLEEALGRDLRSPRPAAAAGAGRGSSFLVEEKPQAEAAVAAATRAPEPARKPVSVDDTLSGEGPTSIDAGDPLAEADFHMAYGLYDQAADLVQLAIKREPKRRDLKLKLLEIFFVWGNRDRFLETARDLHADGGASASDWDKVLIMGKQIAPDDALFAGAPRTTAGGLDLELHTATGSIDMDVGAATGTTPEIDLTGVATDSGLDFVLDEPDRGAADAGAVAPTVETAQLSPTVETRRVPPSVQAEQPDKGGDTEELPIESLGLELGAIESLDDLGKAEELFGAAPRAAVEDTIETPAARARPAVAEPAEDDLLASTSLMKLSEQLAADEGTTGSVDKDETAIIDLSDATGELPALESEQLARSSANYSIPEEAATMSEVGTKLDLARAYVDMGDPDGARSILAEVLQEGNAAQKQEAQRLMASLP